MQICSDVLEIYVYALFKFLLDVYVYAWCSEPSLTWLDVRCGNAPYYLGFKFGLSFEFGCRFSYTNEKPYVY